MADSQDYIKARETDLAAQRHNRSVFVQRLRANPGRSIVLSALFITLGVGLLLLPHRPGIPVGVLAVLAFGVAAWLVAVTFRRS